VANNAACGRMIILSYSQVFFGGKRLLEFCFCNMLEGCLQTIFNKFCPHCDGICSIDLYFLSHGSKRGKVTRNSALLCTYGKLGLGKRTCWNECGREGGEELLVCWCNQPLPFDFFPESCNRFQCGSTAFHYRLSQPKSASGY
jgi:hypothetical protein